MSRVSDDKHTRELAQYTFPYVPVNYILHPVRLIAGTSLMNAHTVAAIVLLLVAAYLVWANVHNDDR